MPHVIVRAEVNEGAAGPVLLQERVQASDLESDHFSAQLIERVGWAIVDAEESEREVPSEPVEPAP